MMFVIAGLGNPGKEYENTRHNMGFKVIDALASELGVDVKREKFHALIGQGKIGNEKIILVKPQTYMNRSGIAVREIAMYYNIPPEKLIVIYDDIDIPLTSIRIRKAGGPGTHNGMRSVVKELGINSFPRIRIGVGTSSRDENLVNRVIGKVPKGEQKILEDIVIKAADAVKDIVALGIDTAMNRHNYTPPEEKEKIDENDN